MKFFPSFKITLMITILSGFIVLTGATVGNANVRCVQTFLSKTVFDPGPVDGAWGKKTATALADFAEYHKVEFSKGINRKNAPALCDELINLDRLMDQPSVRRFQVNISVGDLENFTGRKQLDVSKLNLMTNATRFGCRFSISRKQIESKKIELLASGKFSVEGGIIKFGENSWYTNGLADSSYLIEQGILALADDYLLHGTIPYFHLFVSPGEIAHQPMQIEFSGTASEEVREFLKVDETWRKVYPFYVDTFQSGILDLRC